MVRVLSVGIYKCVKRTNPIIQIIEMFSLSASYCDFSDRLE